MGPPPPAPPHPADAGNPHHFNEQQIAQRRRQLQKGWETLQRFRAQKDKTDPLSEEQRLRKVQKGREILQRSRATKDAKDRGAPGVAAHRFRVTFEGRDNITGRFCAPVENPFKICAPPPCDATPWSLCAPPGSPESPVTRAAEAQILLETLVDPPPHARISRVLDGAKADIFWYVLHRTLLRWNATTTVSTISLPTLLNPRRLAASMRTPTPSLPLLNPIASCDSRQDEDGVCGDPTRPLNQKSKSAWRRKKRLAQRQADKQGTRTSARPPPTASATHASQPSTARRLGEDADTIPSSAQPYRLVRLSAG